MTTDKFIINKDNFIIPIMNKVQYPSGKHKTKVINLDSNNILSRLGALRTQQKENKLILSKAQGQLIQISKEINQILDELE